MCTAGAFYFLNEADVVICSDDATFFDSHVSYGFVSAIEPIGLMRRIGLGETLRMALTGNAERVVAETALRLGLVSEVVSRAELWPRAHELARLIASYPGDGDAGHGARDLGVARQALPRRDGAGPHVHAHGQPARSWPGSGAHRDATASTPEGSMTVSLLPSGSTRSWRSTRRRPRSSSSGRWYTWGDLAPAADRGRRRAVASAGLGAGAPVGADVAQPPGWRSGTLLGLLRAGACVVTVNPLLGAERLRADLSSLDLPLARR